MSPSGGHRPGRRRAADAHEPSSPWRPAAGRLINMHGCPGAGKTRPSQPTRAATTGTGRAVVHHGGRCRGQAAVCQAGRPELARFPHHIGTFDTFVRRPLPAPPASEPGEDRAPAGILERPPRSPPRGGDPGRLPVRVRPHGSGLHRTAPAQARRPAVPAPRRSGRRGPSDRLGRHGDTEAVAGGIPGGRPAARHGPVPADQQHAPTAARGCCGRDSPISPSTRHRTARRRPPRRRASSTSPSPAPVGSSRSRSATVVWRRCGTSSPIGRSLIVPCTPKQVCRPFCRCDALAPPEPAGQGRQRVTWSPTCTLAAAAQDTAGPLPSGRTPAGRRDS